MREEEAKANRLTELRRADEDKARRQAERDAKEAAEQAKRMEEREAALEEYRAQREKDLNTLTTNVDLSFDDQQAFFDKGRRGAGSAARTAKDQSETQFQEDYKKGSHIAFTSQDVGKRIIIEDDGKVVCGGLVRAVEWELGTRPPTMVGIIADVSRLPCLPPAFDLLPSSCLPLACLVPASQPTLALPPPSPVPFCPLPLSTLIPCPISCLISYLDALAGGRAAAWAGDAQGRLALFKPAARLQKAERRGRGPAAASGEEEGERPVRAERQPRGRCHAAGSGCAEPRARRELATCVELSLC
jgi:hypothetical protein